MSEMRPTRRRMLRSGAGMAASVLVAESLWSSEAAPDKGDTSIGKPDPLSPSSTLPAAIRLSLAGYSFREVLDQPGKPGKMSLKDLVDYAAALGIEGVEPTSYYFLSTDDDFVYDLKRHAFRRGMEISGTPIRSIFNYEPGEALDAELAHVRKWVDICVKLGSPVIRVFAGKKRPETSREQDIRTAIEGMKRACEYAGSRGIYLAIENHGYLTETADDVLRLLEGVNHPWLGVNLDTGNFVGAPYEQITRMAPHAVVCQVKSMVLDSKSGQRVEADFHRIITILSEARYRGYVALEYEGQNPRETVPALISELKRCVQQSV